MASPAVSSTLRPPKRPIVPLLLSSFPTPPSFIPLTPTNPSASPASSAFPNTPLNPPPSRPPSTPLPPVPGPSPFAEQHDALLRLVPRSRRSSKLSLASSHSASDQRRDSFASTTSTRPRDSFASSTSASAPSTRSHPRDSTISEAEEHVTANVPESPPDYTGDDSIASISMHDLPDDDGADEPPDARAFHLRMRAARSRSASHKAALRSRSISPTVPFTSPLVVHRPLPSLSPPAPPDPPAVPEPRSPSPDISHILTRTPRPRRRSSGLFSRASNASSLSAKSSPARTSLASSVKSVRSMSVRSTSTKAGLYSPRTSLPNSNHPTSNPPERDSWASDDAEEDYGVPIPRRDRGLYGSPYRAPSTYSIPAPRSSSQVRPYSDSETELDPATVARLEHELEGADSDGASGSESSLDLHTPLPHLMLRHGLLSPNSKLLPHHPLAPHSLTPQRRPSVASAHSAMSSATTTTSGLIKDARDTPMRRTRHRDGRLLRGGIGLTTGLGWSDSEDEDAPSPLTRRLSTLALTRSTSTLSLARSTSTPAPAAPRTHSFSTPHAPHPLSRSHSSGTFPSSSSTDSRPRAPSTASTISIPLPATPEDDGARTRTTDTDKMLPPLPTQTPRRYPSTLGRGLAGGMRAYPSAGATLSATPPRPLQLPSLAGGASAGAKTNGDRAAVPVPGVARAGSGTRAFGAKGEDAGASALKPRTGTGMVYRTSSRMRVPTAGVGRPIAL